MNIRFAIETDGRFDDYARERIGQLAIAVTAGVAGATEGFKTEGRQAIGRVLGERVSFALRGEVFPRGQPSLRAAGAIFVKDSALKIFEAFGQGVTITAHGGKYLAIPTDGVPRAVGGGRGSHKTMTPAEVETHFNQHLKSMPSRRPGVYLLYLDDVVAGKRRGTVRRATRRRLAQGRAREHIVMFILVKSVRLEKRFDLDGLAQRWADRVPELIERALDPEA